MVLASCPPTLEADYHGPGSGPDIGLVPQLVWQACLSSHLGSHQLTAHYHIEHYAAGSFPGKDCKLLITCLTIDMSTQTYNRKMWGAGTDAWQVVQEQPFQMWSKTSNTQTQTLTKAIQAHEGSETPRIWTCLKGMCLISIWSGSSITIYPLPPPEDDPPFNLWTRTHARRIIHC